jgi:hypothetical protein
MAAGGAWKMLVAFACGLVAFAGARVPMPDGYPRVSVGAVRAWAAETKDDAVDAEMLKDLDLLSEVEVDKDRELFQRLRFWERFRLLERLQYLEEEEKK